MKKTDPIIQGATFSRRTFIKGSLAAGAGLMIGFYIPYGSSRAKTDGPFAPNAWIRIDKDSQVTIVCGKSEMGQGTLTAMSMLVADELEADWRKIRVEQALADPAYGNSYFRRGSQSTSASSSIRGSMMRWRGAGAAAREMLIAAAAKEWDVPAQQCVAKEGVVSHRSSGRKLTYGQLANNAASLSVPQEPRLKSPDQFSLIGKSIPRLDTPAKVRGQAVFGIDVKLPGMLIATVAKCPVFGGKPVSFDATRAKAIKGVRHVVQISSGIAVVADNYWVAKQGAAALDITWDEGSRANVSSEEISRTYKEAAKNPGVSARSDGDATKALSNSSKTIEAHYEMPFLAHATMEPMNCTADVRNDECVVWVPTQSQTGSQRTAARITGLPQEKVKVHTTFLGGGFGRRGRTDFVRDAVETSKAVNAPVKVLWSREDDIQHDFYRQANYHVFRSALDDSGNPIAWAHRIVGPSIFAQMSQRRGRGGRRWSRRIDRTSVSGAADLPYAIPNIEVDYVMKDLGIPVSFWRSVGSSYNAFVTESFLDELAAAAGKDPYEFRRRLLVDSPRHKGVLELAATKTGWGKPLPQGRHRGIAVCFSYGSYCAEVAEVSVAPDGKVRVHRVVCAIDCGVTVNPDTIKAQMEGGIVYGLTAALYGDIKIEKGRVQQSNFHDYPLLRINEMPVIEVHIMPSDEEPGGIGEPAVPPIAPAVTNAVFAGTGKRIRSLPIRAAELRKV